MVNGALVIIADDLGWDLFDEGDARGLTPNLRDLRMTGRTYRRFWAAPACSAARAAFLTGCESHRPENGIGSNVGEMEAGLWCSGFLLPRQLEGGSSLIGKLHLVADTKELWPVEEAGFNYWFGTMRNLRHGSGTGGYYDWIAIEVDRGDSEAFHLRRTTYATGETSDRAAWMVSEWGTAEPLVIWSAHDVHRPFDVPPVELAPQSHANGIDEGDPESVVLAKLEAFDTCLGRVVAAARALGWLIVFWGDNGSSEKVGGGKGELSEAGLCTPLILSGPGVQPGEPDTLVQVTDLNATISAAVGRRAGATVPPDSLSIWSECRGLEDGPRTYLRAQKFKTLHAPIPAEWDRAVRDADWKLIAYRDGSFELFHLRTDPGEQYNRMRDMDPEAEAAYSRLLGELPG